MNSADTVHRAAGRVLDSLAFAACMAASSPPPAQVKDRHPTLSTLCLSLFPSFSCSLSKPAPRHCCWSSVAIIAEPQSSSAAVPVAPVLLRLLGPRPAYLHHQAHVVWLSFERRALPYMAAAVSAALTPRPSWPGSLWPCCAPWPATWAPPGVCAPTSRCSAAAPPSPTSPLRPSPTSHSASSAS